MIRPLLACLLAFGFHSWGFGQLPPGHIIVGDTADVWVVEPFNMNGQSVWYVGFDVDPMAMNGTDLFWHRYTVQDDPGDYDIEEILGRTGVTTNYIEIGGFAYPNTYCFQYGDTIGHQSMNWSAQEVLYAGGNFGGGPHPCYNLPDEIYPLRWLTTFAPPYDTVYGYMEIDNRWSCSAWPLCAKLYFSIPDSMVVSSDPELPTASYEVFPNPASTSLRVKMTGAQGELASVQLLDIGGKAVQDWTGETNGEIIMDISSLHEGVYLMVFSQEGVRQTQRVVIHRQ